MRRIRKLASVVLALALMAGLLAVPASAAGKPYITQVEAGSHFSLAVTSDGSLYAWGYATTAKLFPGGKNGSNVPVKLMTGVKSVAASSVGNQGAVEVRKYDEYGYISYYQTPGTVVAIIKENGDLYTWGDNICYQLGKGYYEAEQDSYQPHFVMKDVVKAATNDHACAAVTENGDLYFWGYNLASRYGQGPGGAALYADPTVILTDVQDVELSGNLVVALKKDGTLYGWGSNTFTVLGAFFDDMPYTASPRVIDTNVRSVDAGDNNIYYIKNDNSLWSLGYGKGGLRGIGNDIGYTASDGHDYDYPYWPTRVDTDVRSVSGGASHALYLKNDGTMWSFGGPEHTSEGGAILGRGSTWGETVSFVDRGETFYSHSAYQWHAAKCGLSYGSFASQFGTFFRDVADDAYYYDAVIWAVDQGITNGTSAAAFSPNQTCTRAQIITFLWRAAGSPAPAASHTVPDVAEGEYYSTAVQWAAENNLFNEGTLFRPNDPCTRGAAVEFMWRADGCVNITTETGFTDVPMEASYSIAVDWAVLQGITNGTSATTFSPEQTCTRGQIVTFLYRAFA